MDNTITLPKLQYPASERAGTLMLRRYLAASQEGFRLRYVCIQSLTWMDAMLMEDVLSPVLFALPHDDAFFHGPCTDRENEPALTPCQTRAGKALQQAGREARRL